MQGLYFVYFYNTYCHIFLMFYIYICLSIDETSSCERGILGLYFVSQSADKSKLYTGLHESILFVYAVFVSSWPTVFYARHP